MQKERVSEKVVRESVEERESQERLFGMEIGFVKTTLRVVHMEINFVKMTPQSVHME